MRSHDTSGMRSFQNFVIPAACEAVKLKFLWYRTNDWYWLCYYESTWDSSGWQLCQELSRMKIFRPANLSFLVTKSIRNNKRHARARRWRGGHLFVCCDERKNKEQTLCWMYIPRFWFHEIQNDAFLLYLDSTHGLIWQAQASRRGMRKRKRSETNNSPETYHHCFNTSASLILIAWKQCSLGTGASHFYPVVYNLIMCTVSQPPAPQITSRPKSPNPLKTQMRKHTHSRYHW